MTPKCMCCDKELVQFYQYIFDHAVGKQTYTLGVMVCPDCLVKVKDSPDVEHLLIFAKVMALAKGQ